MALKEYKYRGGTYQFDEDRVPKGAVPVEVKVAPAPQNKARRSPANKGKAGK